MAVTAPNPPVSRIEAEVQRTRALVEKRQFAAALAAAQNLLAEVPENRDVLYLIAVSQRCLGRVADALRTLLRIEAIHPDYGRMYQERGHCYRAVGETDAAIAAYGRAVTLNPTLHASWTALKDLNLSAGREAEADKAAAHLRALANLPPAVVGATNMFSEGDIYGAERVVRHFLQTHGDHIEAMRLLAKIGIKLDVLDDAEFLLESILVFAPDYHAARHEYASVLLQRHKYARALEEMQKLLRLDPRNRGYRATYANACVGLGRHDEALRTYRELVAETPAAADLHLSVAHSLKTLGRRSDAIESYRAAAATRPSFGDAYWSLANLKTYRFTDDELHRMRAQEAAGGTSLTDRYHLCFALGKALEDRGEYAESFRYYARGNAFKKSESRYQAEHVERNTRLQIAVCTREFLAARQGVGCDRPDPIFIVGLPRAGSTLLEQILASHSQVEGTMELADIPRLVHQLHGRDNSDSTPRYPGVLTELSSDQLRRFGEKYLEDTRVLRTGKPFFIDKMPNNFRHIGLIHLMLPNAKIIDARRAAMACCFSNFKQLFASGQEFTYSLEDIGRYYRTYVELMAHWDAVLPGRSLRVQHEDVVEDLEGHVRRLLEFCGLEFEQRCLEFYKTERSVRTASSEQVRQPISREGIDQWRHFEPWLGPLKAALGPLAQG
ncbi:MAG TPA: sulfotransferase [Steroidobacteraceae bacterium]|nr:sulfotransferase [Steroidobacteraceae bacterium]